MVKKNCPVLEVEKLRGGNGILHATVLATPEECHGHVMQFRRIVLDPGCSIGYHTHTDDVEYYCILKGNGIFTGTDGEPVRVVEGDVCLIQKGGSHGLENDGDEPLEMLALVIE